MSMHFPDQTCHNIRIAEMQRELLVEALYALKEKGVSANISEKYPDYDVSDEINMLGGMLDDLEGEDEAMLHSFVD